MAEEGQLSDMGLDALVSSNQPPVIGLFKE